MDEVYPVDDGIHVLKEGRKLGPFTVENLLEGLESGDFSENDVCLRPGATECERLRDLLDWEERGEEVGEEEAEEEDFEEGPMRCSDTEERELTRSAGAERIQPPGRSDRLLYSGHPSVLTYPVSLLLVIAGVTGGLWLYPVDPILTLAGFALAAGGLARLSFVRFTHDYHVRTRRIEAVTGFLARSSREVRIEDIRSINVDCRGFSGILGIGTVDFFTSGDSPEVSFEKVWAARRLKSLVRKLQDASE